MFIHSIPHHHVKFQQQKLFSNRKKPTSHHEKIQSFKSPPFIDKKIASTQLKLVELSQNPEMFTQLVIIHRLFIDKIGSPYPYTIDIGNPLDSTKAITQSNLFEQQYFRSIKDFEKFEKELSDDEEGTFSIHFLGLTLTIIKHITSEKQFTVINSLKTYSRKKKILHNLDSFTKDVLGPLQTLMYNEGILNYAECIAYYKLTGHNLLDLLRCPFPQNLSTFTKFGRTSNIASNESIDLKAVNEKFSKSMPSNKG